MLNIVMILFELPLPHQRFGNIAGNQLSVGLNHDDSYWDQSIYLVIQKESQYSIESLGNNGSYQYRRMWYSII